MRNPFTFQYIESELDHAKKSGYHFIRCADFVNLSADRPRKCIVLRVDIDEDVFKVNRLLTIFSTLGIKATFFVRLHGKYNPFEFGNFLTIKRIINEGHELGYHSEVIDQSDIWSDDAAECLKRDLQVLSSMFGVAIRGIASHSGRTGLNNLDFWRDNKAADFGMLYEAYDDEPGFGLFNKSLYLSDSEWTQWKSYHNGILLNGDRRSLSQHLEDCHSLIYLLIHPETYFDRHPYD